MADHEKYETDDARRKALRRLSGALGRGFKEDDVNWTSSLGDYLILNDGRGVTLQRSNAVYVTPDGVYMRNGRQVPEGEVDRLYV